MSVETEADFEYTQTLPNTTIKKKSPSFRVCDQYYSITTKRFQKLIFAKKELGAANPDKSQYY
jgi:hypothetical protein